MATEAAASIRISIDWKLNDERARLDAIEVEMVEWRPNVMSERRERLAAEAEAARVAEQERLVKELELARIAC